MDWKVWPGLWPYPQAVEAMVQRTEALLAGEAREAVWLLEHPPLYTAGTGAKPEELLQPERFPVYQTGRGGKYTYHGPGQRVVYVLMDLARRDRDLRAHMRRLEEWILMVLADFGLQGERREGRIGVWVRNRGRDEKIAALGVRCRRWVTSHGFSLNVDPDLSAYDGIIPCGLRGPGVTSLHALGVAATMKDVDAALERRFKEIF